MNRQQKRELKKNGQRPPKDPLYHLKKSDIDRIKAQAAEEATDAAMALLLAIPIKVLHEQYGWGSMKRLPEFGEKLIDEYQAFDEGKMTLKEYADLVFELTGIRFQKNPDV